MWMLHFVSNRTIHILFNQLNAMLKKRKSATNRMSSIPQTNIEINKIPPVNHVRRPTINPNDSFLWWKMNHSFSQFHSILFVIYAQITSTHSLTYKYTHCSWAHSNATTMTSIPLFPHKQLLSLRFRSSIFMHLHFTYTIYWFQY